MKTDSSQTERISSEVRQGYFYDGRHGIRDMEGVSSWNEGIGELQPPPPVSIE